MKTLWVVMIMAALTVANCAEPLSGDDLLCREDPDCMAGYYCDPQGKCVFPEDLPCTTGNDCPRGWFCNPGTDLCVLELPDDPCDPNPCTEEHKTQCTADGSNAVCSCDSGYHDEDGTCVEDTMCQDNTCSGHGSCDDSSGAPVCTCNEGYAGNACDVCDSGYHWNDDNTVCTSDPCDPNPCNGEHKTQCSADGSNAVCFCDNGYHEEGGDCVADTDCQLTTCSEHGSCDDSSGAPVCTCNEGYAGNACDVCDSGYHDEDGTCVADTDCQLTTCSEHGSCDDSSGAPVCTCNEGYAGNACDVCDSGYIGYPDCQLSWPYESRLVFALTAGETPSIQNGGESDVLFFSITAQDGPAGISVMTFQVTCPNGQVSEAAGEGKLYRSFDGQTYNAITIAGQGAVARYIPDANVIRIGFTQEEMFTEGETKYYRLSPVMSGLSAGEQCSGTMLSSATSGPAFLYHPSETSLLSAVDGVCYESPPNFIWSDLSAGANHLHSTVDFWPCALLEGAEPQPWGSDDYIAGAVNAGVVQVTVTAP